MPVLTWPWVFLSEIGQSPAVQNRRTSADGATSSTIASSTITASIKAGSNNNKADTRAKPLKILSLYWGLGTGGVAKYATVLDQLAANRQMAATPIIDIVHVCILAKGWDLDRSAFEMIDPKAIEIGSRFDLSWRRRLRELVEEQHPDLILTHGVNGQVAVLAAMGPGCAIPKISVYHGPYHPPSAAKRLLAPVYNLASELFFRFAAERIAVVTASAKTDLVRKGVNEEKITVIPNGISDEEPHAHGPVGRDHLASLKAGLGLPPSSMVIGAASRFEPVKGLDLLIDAFDRIAARHLDFVLLLIGGGTIDARLKARAARSPFAGRIVFPGYRNDVAALMQAIDVFVLPSRAEQHSIGLLEAMRAGRAIVATAVGGNGETIQDGIEGLLVPPEDSARLAIAIERLCGDEQERHRLGRQAKARFCHHFTAERMIERTAAWLAARGASARPPASIDHARSR